MRVAPNESVSQIYAYYSDKLKWKIVDPQVSPEIAQRELTCDLRTRGSSRDRNAPGEPPFGDGAAARELRSARDREAGNLQIERDGPVAPRGSSAIMAGHRGPTTPAPDRR